jgi:hypothetical protein
MMDRRMGSGVPAAFSKQEYLRKASGFAGLFPHGIKMEYEAPLVGKDRVAIEARSEGAMSNGGTYGNSYVFVLRFAGDRIAEIREYLATGCAHLALDRAAAE